MGKTIYDVAKEAGVGIATVSRVLNKTGYVSEKTRKKVEAAAKDYVPKAAAREMGAQRAKTLLLAFAHDPEYFFVNSVYMHAMMGIADVCKEKDYRMLMDINRNTEDILELLRSGKADGAILMGMRKNDTLIACLEKESLPFILIGTYGSDGESDFCQIDVDNKALAKEAVQHLLMLGHRKIGFISGSLEYGSCLARLNGYLEALKEAGIKKKEEYIVTTDSITDEKAYNLARKLLYQPDRVSAVFAFNDMVAAAVYKAASDMGMYIPEDLSVVGFDDTEWARYVTPPLTTVRQPSYKKGYDAAKILIESFEHPELRKKSRILDGMLIYRDSCKEYKEQ